MARGGLSACGIMSSVPPRQFGADGDEALFESDMAEKWVGLNTEKKPSIWAAL